MTDAPRHASVISTVRRMLRRIVRGCLREERHWNKTHNTHEQRAHSDNTTEQHKKQAQATHTKLMRAQHAQWQI